MLSATRTNDRVTVERRYHLDVDLEAEWAALAAERQEVERLRSDLLSTVSHELRTPLTLIRTSFGLLLETHPHAAMQTRLLRNIRQSADRHETLLARIWGREYVGEVDYLRVYVRRLRRKLDDDPEHPRCILTERGVGYRFTTQKSANA